MYEIIRTDQFGDEQTWAETQYEAQAKWTTKCLNDGKKFGSFSYRLKKSES